MIDGFDRMKNPKQKVALYFYQANEKVFVLGVHPIYIGRALTVLRKVGFSPKPQ